jgi:hypothetical protein
LGYFDGPAPLVEAMAKVRDSKFESYDAYTPFPVHGLDEAQGLKRSFLPYIVFFFGTVGFILAFALQYWTSAVDWPINVSGKPFNSWPAFVPVMFEVTVLLAGISNFVGMILLCKLPNITSKAFDPGLTRDKFALIIEAPVEESEAQTFLNSIGAKDVRPVYQEGWF